MKSLKRFKPTRSQFIAAAILATSMGLSYAAVSLIPNTFTAGTPASAADVNANFSAVEASIPGINVSDDQTYSPVSATAGTVAQITVTPPANGYVLLQYSGIADIAHTNGTLDEVRVEISDTAGMITFEPSFNLVEVTSAQPSSGDEYYSPIQTQRLFPVTANVTKTFYVRADLHSGTTAYIGYNYLSAMFVPKTIGTLPAQY